MNPNDPYNPNQTQPQAPGTDYHPKTIFSEPQGVAPQQPIPPVNNGAVFGSTPLAAQADTSAAAKTGSKKPLYIALGVGGVTLLIVIISIVAISLSGNKSNKDQDAKQSQPAILQPATNIELEQINNSIVQDISGTDDEKDYPANSLEDKTLGL